MTQAMKIDLKGMGRLSKVEIEQHIFAEVERSARWTERPVQGGNRGERESRAPGTDQHWRHRDVKPGQRLGLE